MKGPSTTPATKMAANITIQPQASFNIGEPTATAVTRQTSLDLFDSRLKKMQSSFLLNNSSPLGKFNANSSQIIENHQNIFRVPQSN